MEISFRWFGSKYDSITLEYIRQIPGINSVITTLYGSKPGEVWSEENFLHLKQRLKSWIEDCRN